jgi:hypothetical protein
MADGVQSVEKSAMRDDQTAQTRFGWQVVLLLAGTLYPVVALVFNLEIPLLGVAIVLLLARELVRRDAGRAL